MFGAMLPEDGWICVAKKLAKGFKHVWFEEVEEAEEYAIAEDRKGNEVYLAQATFKTKESRRQENVQVVRSFWLDIDCGAGKPYPTQGEGALALKDFCTKVCLPLPSVVNSGNGLYAHWILTEAITEPEWKETACLLKSICGATGLLADGTRTADSSSVLRPVGTRNKKDPSNPKTVHLVTESEPFLFQIFREALNTFSIKNNLAVTAPTSQKGSLNAEFASVYSGPPSNAELVRSKCAQLAYIVENQPNLDEPFWYAMVGLTRHFEDGAKWTHEWSKGHPDYTVEETDRKIEQLIRRDIGPTTCAKFHSINAPGCANCPYEVTSPIQLGKVYEVVEPDPPPEIIPEKPELPDGFRLSKQGLVCDITDPITHFYDNELYVTELAWDESLGYETATIQHYLPHEGWKEFKIRSSVTNDSKTFQMALADNHIKIVGLDRKKAMLMYIESYLSKIQRAKKMAQLVCQMGWKDDGRFVLGKNVILPDGTSEAISLAKSVPQSIEAFRTEGALEPWVEATKLFGLSDDMLPLAFAFCAGAFGAPLMKFTGHSGALVAMLGASGVGKTLAGTWILSTYGEPDRLMMLKDDTKNSLIGRLGAYGNLPLYIDEVTNVDPEELSELTYRITQGRDKARLNRNATERSVNNHWQTLAVVSSNASIVDRLSGMKKDASPELNRVLEITVPMSDVLNRDVATGLYRTITENYGHAGIAYIKYIVAHQAEHQAKIDKVVALLDAKTQAQNEERYWSAIAGVTLYGAVCAQKLGLIRFDVSKLFAWAVETIRTMRATKIDVVSTALDSLGQMLDDLANNRLMIGKTDTCIVQPRGPLYVRIETDTDFLFISRAKVQEWCVRNHGGYSAMRRELERTRVLLDANKRKTLGGRTEWAGTQQPCWVIDMKHPSMGKYHAAVKEEAIVRERLAEAEQLARTTEMEMRDRGMM